MDQGLATCLLMQLCDENECSEPTYAASISGKAQRLSNHEAAEDERMDESPVADARAFTKHQQQLKDGTVSAFCDGLIWEVVREAAALLGHVRGVDAARNAEEEACAAVGVFVSCAVACVCSFFSG